MAANQFSGVGDPNGSVFGDPGDIYQDETGGSGSTFWMKESGVGTSTGWVAAASADSVAVIFDDAVAGTNSNIRSDRAVNQSPIDNTKVGITNLGNASAAWMPSTGVTGDYGTIGGGDDNSAGNWATVAGGAGNTAAGDGSFIGGGHENLIAGGGDEASAIVGGYANEIQDGLFASFIGAGLFNVISVDAETAVICGGNGNGVAGQESAIVGGDGNFIFSEDSFVGGGGDNYLRADSHFSSIVGGGSNEVVSGGFSFIGGGDGHRVGSQTEAELAFIGGGHVNYIDNGDCSVIVGGQFNEIGDDAISRFSFIGGGENNDINGEDSVIVGGTDNVVGAGVVAANQATIAGGQENLVTADHGSIGGGQLNTVSAAHGTIPGGSENVVSGSLGYASGFQCEASAYGSTASGLRAKASRPTQESFASGQRNVVGDTQVSWLVLRGAVNAPGTIPLRYNSDGITEVTTITLEDNRAYTFRVRAICQGNAFVQTATIVKEFNVKCIAGVATIVAQAAQVIFGTATAVANWTIVASAAGADVSVDFSTGADAVTPGIVVTAHVEFVEVGSF